MHINVKLHFTEAEAIAAGERYTHVEKLFSSTVFLVSPLTDLLWLVGYTRFPGVSLIKVVSFIWYCASNLFASILLCWQTLKSFLILFLLQCLSSLFSLIQIADEGDCIHFSLMILRSQR